MESSSKIKEVKLDNKILRLGFVGLGWIGRNRMQSLMTDSRVQCAAIVEPNSENVQNSLANIRDLKAATSFHDVLHDKSIDGVVIATPSALHAEQAIAAMLAGKSVFCQKPLGRNTTEIQQTVNVAEQMDKLLAVDLSYRHTKAFAEVYNLVQSGELGEVFSVDLVFHNAYGPDKEWFFNMEKSGGGCVLDLGIHLLDLALWTLNFPEVGNVKSNLFHKGRKINKDEKVVEDYATALLETESGSAINLQCSWHLNAGREAVIEATFYGTKGAASFRNINGSFYDFVAERFNGTQTERLVSPPDDWGGRAALAWADAVLEGKRFDPRGAREQLALAKIIDRIYGRE